MAIITISRGSHSRGKAIAEEVARKLGYECVSREVLLEASDEFRVPEIRLEQALHDAPSFLDRITHGKERYVAYIQQAFLEHIQRDNVVYHGHAGHFFVQGIGHVLKVRVLSDMADRAQLVMEKEKLDEKKALKFLADVDAQRRRWGEALYGLDTEDPRLYDLVLHIRKISMNDAVRIICDTAHLPHFQTTPETQKALDDLLLAARVKAAVVRKWPAAQVMAADGKVIVTVEAILAQEPQAVREITQLVEGVPGLQDLRVNAQPTSLSGPPGN